MNKLLRIGRSGYKNPKSTNGVAGGKQCEDINTSNSYVTLSFNNKVW